MEALPRTIHLLDAFSYITLIMPFYDSWENGLRVLKQLSKLSRNTFENYKHAICNAFQDNKGLLRYEKPFDSKISDFLLRDDKYAMYKLDLSFTDVQSSHELLKFLWNLDPKYQVNIVKINHWIESSTLSETSLIFKKILESNLYDHTEVTKKWNPAYSVWNFTWEDNILYELSAELLKLSKLAPKDEKMALPYLNIAKRYILNSTESAGIFMFDNNCLEIDLKEVISKWEYISSNEEDLENLCLNESFEDISIDFNQKPRFRGIIVNKKIFSFPLYSKSDIEQEDQTLNFDRLDLIKTKFLKFVDQYLLFKVIWKFEISPEILDWINKGKPENNYVVESYNCVEDGDKYECVTLKNCYLYYKYHDTVKYIKASKLGLWLNFGFHNVIAKDDCFIAFSCLQNINISGIQLVDWNYNYITQGLQNFHDENSNDFSRHRKYIIIYQQNITNMSCGIINFDNLFNPKSIRKISMNLLYGNSMNKVKEMKSFIDKVSPFTDISLKLSLLKLNNKLENSIYNDVFIMFLNKILHLNVQDFEIFHSK